MTVRVTTLKGIEAGVYYVEALPSYYLQGEEPPGRWLGVGARQLGLAGEVVDDQFLAVMTGADPNRPERLLGRGFDERSVRGFDVTASAPKSVSVLFALGDLMLRREVLAAHDAAVGVMVEWIERHAHTRYRIGGEVAVVDARGIIAAMFRQHTSRALDPQLHTHVVIANRVKSPDGRWLALDARLIKHDQQTLSARYHEALRAELTARIGVRWHPPEHGIAEIGDVPDDVLVTFSSRTSDVHRRIDSKLDRFIETMGREPTPRERWRLEREAAVDSRPAKRQAINADELHAQWADQVRQLGYDPQHLVGDAVGRLREPTRIDGPTLAGMVDQAIAAITVKQSSWRPTELQRELAAVIPTTVAASADRLVPWLDRVAVEVEKSRCVDLSRPVPANALLRSDGRPVSESVIDRALSTQAIVDQEQGVLEWADRRFDIDPGPASEPTVGERLTVAQAQAASAVSGRDDLVLIVGPAGTGKTTALNPAVKHLRSQGRAVFGVAASATAAEVLSSETGVAADTLDKLLIEHRLGRRPQPAYELPPGATIIVDEAGMVPTAKLAELADLADVRGWRVILVGDPLQFAAVGRGGMFGLLVDTFGAIELDTVHRFANEWERDANLRLRRGDVEVAQVYDERGRLHGGTLVEMERRAVATWWHHRTRGEATLLITATNEAVERLNHRAQQRRIATGDLGTHGPNLLVGGSRMYVGDEVVTRRNERRLSTDRGEMVRNRAEWTITTIHPDQSVTVDGRHGTVRLPASYVCEHVELGYARTGHGSQGRTVRNAIVFLEGPTNVRNLYVPMTRGTHLNEAFIACTGEETARDVFTQCLTTDWIDQPALSRHAELNSTKPHRAGMLDGDTIRDLLERRLALSTAISRAEAQVARAPQELAAVTETKAVARSDETRLTAAVRSAGDVIARYDRPLHRRRHETELRQARQDLDRLPERIAHARNAAAKAAARIEQLEASQVAAAMVLAARPAHDATIAAINQRLAHDTRIRSRAARLERPTQLIETLGPRPAPGPAARSWDAAAGELDQHQAAFNVTDGLGPNATYMTRSAYTLNWERMEQLTVAVRPPEVDRRIPEIELPSISR